MIDAEKGLIEAIQAARTDDDARLVYADWLEENNERLKAEYIRREIKLASVGYEVTRYAGIEREREQFEDLSRAVDPEWRASIARAPRPRVAPPLPGARAVALIDALTPPPPQGTNAADLPSLPADAWSDIRPRATYPFYEGRPPVANSPRHKKRTLILMVGILLFFILKGCRKSGCSLSDLEKPQHREGPSNPIAPSSGK